MRKTTGANDNFAKSTTQVANSQKLARYEMINLGRQVQDVGVSLASGQAPLTVLIQQGSQIADVFATSNISLKNFAAQMLPIAARWGPIAAGVTAVVGTFVLLNREMEKNLETQRAMSGAGRFAGATAAGIAGAAERTAGAGGVSLGSAREGILAGVRAGVPGMDVIERANALAQRYAATIGIELPAAQKELAAALAEPGRGAEALDDKLKFLDATTIRYIKTLEAAGKRGEAARVILDNLLKPNVLVSQADAVNIWGQAWAFAVDQDGGSRRARYLKLITVRDWIGRRLLLKRRARQLAVARCRARWKGSCQSKWSPRICDRASIGRSELGPKPRQCRRNSRRALRRKQKRLDKIKLTIKDATQAYEDQVRVLNAMTVAQQAAAAVHADLQSAHQREQVGGGGARKGADCRQPRPRSSPRAGRPSGREHKNVREGSA